jgi:phosphoglycolate phosphatase-like HAD superfamily hydrolase
MKKTVLVLIGLAVGLLLVSAACGSSGKAKPTSTAPAKATATSAAPKATATGTASTTPPSAAELKADLADIKAVLQDTLAKAQAGDVPGTRVAEAKGDKSMEAIIRALRAVGTATPTALGDQIEAKELAYEAQADSANTDLTALAKDAQDALTLLTQAGIELGISQ